MESINEDELTVIPESEVTGQMPEHSKSASMLRCQELRAVWNDVQTQWATLLEAEAQSHYDSLQRDELTAAQEQLEAAFPPAVLAVLESTATASIDILLMAQQSAQATPELMVQQVESSLLDTASELCNLVPELLRQPSSEAEVCLLTADMIAREAEQSPALALGAHVWLKLAYNLYQNGRFFHVEMIQLPLESTLLDVQLPDSVPLQLVQAWAQLSESWFQIIPDALFVSLVCNAQTMGQWAHVEWETLTAANDVLHDTSAAVSCLETMSAIARQHSSALLEASFRLRLFNWHSEAAAGELGTLLEDRALGLSTAARELSEALLLAYDYQHDPLAACGGDEDVLAQLQQRHAFPLYDTLQRLSSDDGTQLLAYLHDCERTVLAAAKAAVPEELAVQPVPAASALTNEEAGGKGFTCSAHELEDWGALLSAACQLAMDNQAELAGRQLPKGDAASTSLIECQEIVQQAAKQLQILGRTCVDAEDRDSYAECAAQLSALQSGLRIQYSALLKADGKHEEVAVFMEQELRGLISGEDSIALLQLEQSALADDKHGGGDEKQSENKQRIARLQRKQHLLQVRQAVLFALRCSTAWGTLQKWENAERVIWMITEFLENGQQPEGAQEALCTKALTEEYRLLPVEVAVLRSMAWTQLARAYRSQGQEEKYFETMQSQVIEQLSGPLRAHGEALLRCRGEVVLQSDAAQRALAVAHAVYHTGQYALFTAVEEVLKPRSGLHTQELLFDAYNRLERHSGTLRVWAELAPEMMQHTSVLHRMSGQSKRGTQADENASVASYAFIWKLPTAEAEVRQCAAQIEFWSGRLMQHSAYLAVLDRDAVTSVQHLEEIDFALRHPFFSHERAPHSSENLAVSLWHFQQALAQLGFTGNSAETDEVGAASTSELPLWAYECAHLLVLDTVRAAGAGADQCASTSDVQTQVDWAHVSILCSQVLQQVDLTIVHANPRLQLAVAGLQRHQAMAMCHTVGVDEAVAYATDAASRTEAMVKAAMKSLHELEDEGADVSLLAKIGRCVLLIQQIGVAQHCDLAHMGALLQGTAGAAPQVGNKVGQHIQAALKSVEVASRYRGIEVSYPDAARGGFPLLTWRPQLTVMESHVHTLLQLVFDATFACAHIMTSEAMWTNNALTFSFHRVLRRESEQLFSLEGAVDDTCSIAYTGGPAADLAARRARTSALAASSVAPQYLMCAGLLHKLATWLEGQHAYASAVAAARPAYFNALFAAGNIFRMVGNDAGEQRSRTKAAEALRQAIEFYSTEADLFSAATQQALVRRTREALATCLDELGACLLDVQLPKAALEAFSECRDLRVVLYTSTAGESAFSAKFNNEQYVWVTLAGMVEAAIRCDMPSIAVDISKEQAELLDTATQQNVCFWTLVAKHSLGRSLLQQGFLENGYSCLQDTANACNSLASSSNLQPCPYRADGTRVAQQPHSTEETLKWGAPGTLYSKFKPAGLSPARLLLELRLRCVWQMAEAARSMFRLQEASSAFEQWLSIRKEEHEAWQSDPISRHWVEDRDAGAFDGDSIDSAAHFVREVELADVLHGLAATQIQLGEVDAAMVSLQSSREQRLQSEGMLSKQYTSCVVDIARHFLTHASDCSAAVDFLQHPLGLLAACLAECRRRQGHNGSDADSEISDSDSSDSQESDEDLDDLSDLSTGMFAQNAALSGRRNSLTSALLGVKEDLGVLAEEDEDDLSDSSDDDESSGSNSDDHERHKKRTAAGSSQTTSKQHERAQVARVSGKACLDAIISNGVLSMASADYLRVDAQVLIPQAPDDVDAAEAVDWQLQLGGGVDDMALDALTSQLQRQVAAILYHIGLALALQGDLPQPPQPLDSFDDIGVAPGMDMVQLMTTPCTEVVQPDDDGQGDGGAAAEADAAARQAVQIACRQALLAWGRALQLELLVKKSAAKGEYTPSIIALKCIARIGHLLHFALGETDNALTVLSLGCRWLLDFPRLATAAERNVAPVLWICLSACKAHLGDFMGSAAAGGMCIDGLRAAKDSMDARDGVDLMAAMQSMSLMAQYECLALCFQARVYVAQEMPDTALACLKAADRTLQQYTSASSPHTARILYWDARIVAIQEALAQLYEDVGDSVKAEQVLAAARALQAEREEEGDAVTAAVAAAAREGMW